ncbi:MAG: hypothetical protein ACXWC9_01710 [Pseudobdellovibrionaceae bacterium]
MKNIMICLIALFASASAFAQPINLQAGSSVVINGDLVSCEGPSEENLPPACSIKQDSSFYRLYAGTVIAESFHTFAAAVEGAKKMKEAGLCR